MSLHRLSRPAVSGHPAASELNLAIDLIAGRITLAGELDRQTAHHLLDAARTLSETAHRRWVLDAGELRFCDASGLRAISACYRKALRHGSNMSIVSAGPWLLRALAALRLDNHLMDCSTPLGDQSGLHDTTYPPRETAFPLVKFTGALAYGMA